MAHDVMDADEKMRDDETGALSPAAAASLSTNATAFCIASLLGGASDRDDGQLTTTEQQVEPDVDDHSADMDDLDANESKISGETYCD